MIAEASAIAYKGAPNDIQQKLRRVVEVWGQRLIWEPDVQTAIVAKIDGKSSKSFVSERYQLLIFF